MKFKQIKEDKFMFNDLELNGFYIGKNFEKGKVIFDKFRNDKNVEKKSGGLIIGRMGIGKAFKLRK